MGTITLEPHPETASMQLRLEDATAATVSVERKAVWPGYLERVRGAQRIGLHGGIATVQDAECPLDESVEYHATFYDAQGNVVGSAVATGSVASNGQDWLKSLTHPSLSTPVTVVGMSGESTESRNGLFQILGRKNPLVVTDVRSGRAGTLVLYQEQRVQRVRDLLADGSILMFHTPAERGYGKPLYMSVGTVHEERVSPLGSFPGRTITLEWVEVDAPVGDVSEVIGTSYQIIADSVATYEALDLKFATYYDMLTKTVGDSGPARMDPVAAVFGL